MPVNKIDYGEHPTFGLYVAKIGSSDGNLKETYIVADGIDNALSIAQSMSEENLLYVDSIKWLSAIVYIELSPNAHL